MTERKAILVAGGAGGMGRATAVHFARQGWFVGLFDNDAPLLKAADNALCIGTSSSVATCGHALPAVCTASRFAVKGLTEALSLEFERFGIRTAGMLPGCIDTPMLRAATVAGSARVR